METAASEITSRACAFRRGKRLIEVKPYRDDQWVLGTAERGGSYRVALESRYVIDETLADVIALSTLIHHRWAWTARHRHA